MPFNFSLPEYLSPPPIRGERIESARAGPAHMNSPLLHIHAIMKGHSNNERSISSFNKCTVLTKTESKLFLQRKADKYYDV